MASKSLSRFPQDKSVGVRKCSKPKPKPQTNDIICRSNSVEIKIISPDVYLQGSNFTSTTRNHSITSLVAVKDIEPGEKIYCERPFVWYTSDVSVEEQIKAIQFQIATLTRHKSHALSIFLSLSSEDPSINVENREMKIVDEFSVQ